MSQLQITQAHIKGAPKLIGHLEGCPVFLLTTKGGFNVILARMANGAKALATAPHPGIAKAMATRGYPDLVLDELSKSEAVNPAHFEHLLPVWQKITDELNAQLEG